jgi:hypothetical protein
VLYERRGEDEVVNLACMGRVAFTLAYYFVLRMYSLPGEP